MSSGGFTILRGILKRHFRCSVAELRECREEELNNFDVLVLCTTEAPELTEDQVAALSAWVQRGGCLVVSAFSNWSGHQHFATRTVGWLGISTLPQAQFEGMRRHRLEPPEGDSGEAARRILAGPFGKVRELVNLGESEFELRREATQRGAVILNRSSSPEHSPQLATLVYYPPCPVARGGVSGNGRVLVCSNYHWLADPEWWNGGLIAWRPDSVEDGEALRPNQTFLLNFIADAVASRSRQA